MIAGRVVWAIVAAVLVLGACSQSDSDDDGAEAGAGVVTGRANEVAQGAQDEGAGGSTVVNTSSQLPGVGPAVIKTARLDIEVAADSLQEAIDDAMAIANRTGGFVLSTRLENERSGTGEIVLRVPAENFATALSQLDDLGRVSSRTVSGEDVSEEFVDLDARLRNLEAQEAALLRLMDRARSVADTIRVQRELTPVQLEIERIRGRLRFLEDQTSFSTITMSMTESGVKVAQDSTLEKAWKRAGEMFLSVVYAIVVSLGVVVPVGVLALIGLVIGVKILRPRSST